MGLTHGHRRLGNGPVTVVVKVFSSAIKLDGRITFYFCLLAAMWLNDLADKRELIISRLKCKYLFAQVLILLQFFHVEDSYNK